MKKNAKAWQAKGLAVVIGIVALSLAMVGCDGGGDNVTAVPETTVSEDLGSMVDALEQGFADSVDALEQRVADLAALVEDGITNPDDTDQLVDADEPTDVDESPAEEVPEIVLAASVDGKAVSGAITINADQVIEFVAENAGTDAVWNISSTEVIFVTEEDVAMIGARNTTADLVVRNVVVTVKDAAGKTASIAFTSITFKAIPTDQAEATGSTEDAEPAEPKDAADGCAVPLVATIEHTPLTKFGTSVTVTVTSGQADPDREKPLYSVLVDGKETEQEKPDSYYCLPEYSESYEGCTADKIAEAEKSRLVRKYEIDFTYEEIMANAAPTTAVVTDICATRKPLELTIDFSAEKAAVDLPENDLVGYGLMATTAFTVMEDGGSGVKANGSTVQLCLYKEDPSATSTTAQACIVYFNSDCWDETNGGYDSNNISNCTNARKLTSYESVARVRDLRYARITLQDPDFGGDDFNISYSSITLTSLQWTATLPAGSYHVGGGSTEEIDLIINWTRAQ